MWKFDLYLAFAIQRKREKNPKETSDLVDFRTWKGWFMGFEVTLVVLSPREHGFKTVKIISFVILLIMYLGFVEGGTTTIKYY